MVEVEMTMVDETRRVALRGEMTIYTAAQLSAELKPHLEREALELHLDSVQEIDSAGLQLLLMLRRESAARGRSLRIGACSEPVLDVLKLCNLADAFGLGTAAGRNTDGKEANNELG